MNLFNNPHPAFPAELSAEQTSICDLGCYERYMPKKLRSNELFKQIDYLGCHGDNQWTDDEMFAYLEELSTFFRKSLNFGTQILNWYSLINWLQASQFTWESSSTGFGIDDDDFYSRYDLSTKDIWLSMSAANGNTFNESGFNYFQWMIDPYIGTNLIQRKIIEKLELDAVVVDWYDNKNIINAYSFVMDNFPGWEKAKLIIINSKLMKNAESILISLRDERCPHRLLLSDGGHLDRDFLSDISAQKFEGVHICFQRYKSVIVDLFTPIADDFIRYEVLSTHMYLIDYFASYSLSVNLQLDGLADRTVFSTKTNIWPTKFVQLLPAVHGNNSNWSPNKTWEDHYDWMSVNITNLIRNYLPYEEDWEGQGWPQDEDWQRWRDWSGRLNADWKYNKPNTSADPRRDYYENPNYPPTYEPATGISLYRPIIQFDRNSIGVGNVQNNKSQIINFWDEFFLSDNEFISPATDQLPVKYIITRFTHASEAV